MFCESCLFLNKEKLGLKGKGYCKIKKEIVPFSRIAQNCRYYTKEEWEAEIVGPLAITKTGVYRIKDMKG